LIKRISIVCLIVILCGCATTRLYTVTKVVDGDTLILNGKKKVRLIGVDAPESRINNKFQRDIKNSGCTADQVLSAGEESKYFLSKFVNGEKIYIKLDGHKKDRYGRFLVYAFLKDNERSINETIIFEGYGVAYTKYNFKYKERFLKAEENAKALKKGIWKAGCL